MKDCYNCIEFIINSSDRNFGTSANYTINIKDFVRLPNGQKAKYYKVVGINFTNGLYNINNNNNTITIFETTATSNTVIILPNGNYNASQLATQLQTSFNSATQVSNTYTVIYNSETYKMTITANTQTFYFVNTSYLLGMMNNSNASLSQTSSQGVKLLYDFLVFKCDLFGSFTSTSQICNNGSFIIPLGSINVGYTGFIGKLDLPNIIRPFNNQTTFTVEICDPFNNTVDLNNYDHQIFLELS
jgi:hypothetical protein